MTAGGAVSAAPESSRRPERSGPRGLEKLRLNERIRGASGRELDLERWLAIGLYCVILLLARFAILALAFGLRGREAPGREMEHWLSRMRERG